MKDKFSVEGIFSYYCYSFSGLILNVFNHLTFPLQSCHSCPLTEAIYLQLNYGYVARIASVVNVQIFYGLDALGFKPPWRQGFSSLSRLAPRPS